MENYEYDHEPSHNLSQALFKLSIDIPEDTFSDSPLLRCKDTIGYVAKSKVLILMKGLPGSGKSTIVQHLTKLYPSFTVCSADKYFEGKKIYKFDPENLSQAHSSCQKAAISAFQDGASPVIVDNTNIRLWEMKFYLDLADEFKYLVIVLEPNTPWSKNPTVLAERNSHGVDIKMIKNKIRSYESLYPLYFGWFLNEDDSDLLMEMTLSWLSKAFGVAEFSTDVKKRMGVFSIEDLVSHFSDEFYSLRRHRLLHCTTKYCVKEEPDVVDRYLGRARLKQWLGRVTSLSVVGFVVTPRTVGAKVDLSKSQLEMWENDKERDEEAVPKGKRGRRHYAPPNGVGRQEKIPPYRRKEKTFKSSLTEEPQNVSLAIGELFSNGKGSKAHITLGTAKDVAPVETGRDFVALIKGGHCEERSYSLPGGTLKQHRRGCWSIWPDNKVLVDALFTFQL